MPITELKWDARTLTDISGSTAYWFFAFFWLTEGSRNKKLDNYIKQIYLAHIFIKVFGYSDRHGDRKGVKNIGKSSYFNLPPDIGFYIIYSNQGAYRQSYCIYL